MEKLNILHIDMDAFFAAIEIRDNPDLKGKPVIIGGADPTARGVVSTASYEARKFGIHSAMPLVEAYRRCPRGIFLAGDMAKYEQVSRQLLTIFSRYTPLVEPISLDEAFLDVTGCEGLFGDILSLGRKIKEEIKSELGLVASIGISYNKFLAKLASDLEKPDGFVVITPRDLKERIWALPVNKLWGVGEKTAGILREQGLDTLGKVARMEPKLLEAKLGSVGKTLWELARGIDNRKVEPVREAKSIGREITFPQDESNYHHLETALCYLAEEVALRLQQQGLRGKTLTLKVRFSDFKTITRRLTLTEPTNLSWRLFGTASHLLTGLGLKGRTFRLIGLSVSNLKKSNTCQLPLFKKEDLEKEEKVAEVIFELKKKYGREIITPARLLNWRQD